MKTRSLAIIVGAGIVVAIIFAFLLMKTASIQENNGTTNSCDLACKDNLEKTGYICAPNLDAGYTCRAPSSHGSGNVIPWGSAKMPNQRNFIDNNITVSLEINNTVAWTNVDDYPHRIASDGGLFDSGIIQPNATWVHVFDKLGKYGYHDPSHQWLHGEVNVIPLDHNYRIGEPIWKNLYGAFKDLYLSDSALFRETDHWGYIKRLSVLDNNTVLVGLADYQNGTNVGPTVNRTISIGDTVTASCGFIGHSQISDLVLQRISNTGTKFAEFDEHVILEPGNLCNFYELTENKK